MAWEERHLSGLSCNIKYPTTRSLFTVYLHEQIYDMDIKHVLNMVTVT